MLFELSNVVKLYGSHVALNNLSVQVAPGAIGLLGPNGAGKSTLIKLLLGLVKLNHGAARILDTQVRRGSDVVRQQVGYMPEDDCTIAGLKGIESVSLAGELAGLPPRVALRRGHEILDYVRLGEERYREVQTYSTGMRQRMKLAQALVHSPKVVFLDEPTSGLDPKGRRLMLELVRDLVGKKGMSVVISTHILTDIEACCESVLILSHGALRVYDTLENLQRSESNEYIVRLLTPTPKLAEELRTRGLEVQEQSNDEMRVRGAEGEDVGPSVFAAAAACKATVREVRPRETTLEEIYLGTMQERQSYAAV